jgi:hypothetical protein
MSATASIDFTGFNAGMAGLVRGLGIESKVVVIKEVSELIKRLVRTTPAADVKKIRSNINAKFVAIGDSNNSWHDTHSGGKQSSSGITWFSVSSDFLRGVAPQKDMRGASVLDLDKLSYKITKRGDALNVPIRGHERQRAIIYQTIVTKKSTVNKVIANRITHRGRLKAGWMASVFGGVIGLSGVNMPPSFVTRHKDKFKGYYIDNLNADGFPSFSIANQGDGIGSKRNQMNSIVQNAIDGRADSMKENLALYMSGKKYISDYAK